MATTTPAMDAEIAGLADQIKSKAQQLETKHAQLASLLPGEIVQSSQFRYFENILGKIYRAVSDLLWDLSWYPAAWRDQERWLTRIQTMTTEMSKRVEAYRPGAVGRAGWHRFGAEEYVSHVFGPKTVRQPGAQQATQQAAIDRIGYVGRMASGALGTFVGDVKNYALAMLAVLSAVIAAVATAVIAALSAPVSATVGWAVIIPVVMALIGAYAYYRAAYEDYVTHLRINTELLRTLATESAGSYPNYRWPVPCSEAGWPYVDQKAGRVKLRESDKPR